MVNQVESFRYLFNKDNKGHGIINKTKKYGEKLLQAVSQKSFICKNPTDSWQICEK